MAINREQILHAQALQTRATLLNTTAPEAIAATFAETDLTALDAYQQATPLDRHRVTVQPDVIEGQGPTEPYEVEVEGLLSRPVPPDFSAKYSGHIHLLTHNKHFHDETVEDIIEADDVITSLMQRRRDRNGNDEILMDALRARRTVIGTLYHLGRLGMPSDLSEAA